MKHLISFKLFESQEKKIYYHGRDPHRRPYGGNYIYITDNMGYAISYSDMKELWAFTLKFPESQIFTLTNPKNIELFKKYITPTSWQSLYKSSDVELDWNTLSNVEPIEPFIELEPEELFERLGFKAIRLRERPGIYSVYVFDQNNLELIEKIDLTTQKMRNFYWNWIENPGFKMPDQFFESNFVKLGDLCEVKLNFPDADFWLERNGLISNVGKPLNHFSADNIGIKVIATDILDTKFLFYYLTYLQQMGEMGKMASYTQLHHVRVADIKNIKLNFQ